VFEFDINWDEHSGACEDVYVFGFIGPSFFSIQYRMIVPEKWCVEPWRRRFCAARRFCFGFVGFDL
jgi:hypothetical protein